MIKKLFEKCVEIDVTQPCLIVSKDKEEMRKTVYPLLNKWKNPVFAIDLTGNFFECLSLSKKGSTKVLKAEGKYGYEPFSLINKEEDIPFQMELITNTLIYEMRVEAFTREVAKKFLNASLLMMYEKGSTFLEAIDFVLSDDSSFTDKLNYINENGSKHAKKYTLGLPGDEVLYGAIDSCLRYYLSFAEKDKLRDILSNDKAIEPEDLEHGKNVFISMLDWNDMNESMILTTLFVNQFLNYFSKRGSEMPILCCLDELGLMKKLNLVENLLTSKGTNVHYLITLRSLEQLDRDYGKEKDLILGNIKNKIFLEEI